MSSRAPSSSSPGARDANPGWPPVSLVLTVLNEERHLHAAIAAVLGQDYPAPIEVVMALGPSRDRTDDVAAALVESDPRVSAIANPSGRTPQGLNRAIEKTHYPVIARVDGHSELPPDYLRIAVETLLRTGADNVGGLMWAEGQTPFEQAVARAMTSKLGVGNAPFHVGGEEGPADTVYLGVFRRTALDRVGGYDEDFVRAQDWEMNYRIRSTGGTVYFSPKLSVSYRPRSSLTALAQQYFHYGRWRRQVMRAHPGSINLRYLAPPLALLGVLVGLVLSTFLTLWGLTLPLGYLVLVLAGSVDVGPGLPIRLRPFLSPVVVTVHKLWGGGFFLSWGPAHLNPPR